MSLLSQFYPSGDNKINTTILLVAGGGSGGPGPFPIPGSQTASGGRGGGGGVLYGQVTLNPGPYPIVIGGGGSNSSFGSYNVFRGGNASSPGVSGGSGGGGNGPFNSTPSGPFGGSTIYSQQVPSGETSGTLMYYGKPGDPAPNPGGSPWPGGDGGGASPYDFPTVSGFKSLLEGVGTASSIYAQGAGGGVNTGNGGNPSSTPTSTVGGTGVFIIKYPTEFAAAPSFPGATDISPSTPGYRTYKFTSTGSITLP